MNNYKHISFDLWLTLIKSNPEFKARRDFMFYELFNPCNFSLEEVSAIIRRVDISSNQISEITQIHVPCERMIYDILKDLVNEEIEYSTILTVKNRIQSLFIQYPPSLYDKDTAEVLSDLFNLDCILNILSNTGFITGRTLDTVLTSLRIRKYFRFAIYSDEIKVSKPNSAMFDKVSALSPYRLKDIIHVGDNLQADGASEQSGIEYFQINSNNKTIIDLLTHE